MPETEEGAQLTPSLWKHAETATRLAALLIATTYGCGFVVVTFSQARLGIVEFAALRPRLLSAGVAFIFFVTIPLFFYFRTFRLFGFIPAKHQNVGWEAPTDRHNQVFRFIPWVAFAGACYWTTTSFFGTVFSADTPTVKRSGWYGVIAVAVLVGYTVLWQNGKKLYLRSPVAFLSVAFVTTVALFVTGFWLGNASTAWLAVWFVLVPALFAMVRHRWSGWRAENLESLFPTLLLALLMYSVEIYPRLKPEFGGGFPPKVTIFLAEKGPLAGANSRLDVRLLDEVEQGYYLQAEHGTAAYFLPRADVAAIQFVEPSDSFLFSGPSPK